MARLRRARIAPLSWLLVLAALALALVPQIASAMYAFTDREGRPSGSALGMLVVPEKDFLDAGALTAVITVITVLLVLLVLTPAVVALHVWAPQWRGMIAALCTVPLIVPAIALAAGLIAVLRAGAQQGRGTWPNALSQLVQSSDVPIVLIGTYVVLSLPFCFRALDAGLRGLELQTLFHASASLGASPARTLWLAVAPNIRGPLLYCACFAVSLSLGEYTIAATLGQRTLPVWLTTIAAQDFRASIAFGLLMSMCTWALLIIASVATRPAAQKGTRS